MAEFLEKEKVRERIKNYGKGAIDCGFKTLDPVVDITALVNMVDFMPAADVVEIRHGRWEYYECVSSFDGLKSGYACSVCNSFVEDEYFEAEEFHKKFCGNCGAKMDGER